jgi:hypothetical protein
MCFSRSVQPYATCWGALCDAPDATGLTTCYCPVRRNKKSSQKLALEIPASMCGAKEADGSPVDYCDAHRYTLNSHSSAALHVPHNISLCVGNSDPGLYNSQPEVAELGNKITKEIQAIVDRARTMAAQIADEQAKAGL